MNKRLVRKMILSTHTHSFGEPGIGSNKTVLNRFQDDKM